MSPPGIGPSEKPYELRYGAYRRRNTVRSSRFCLRIRTRQALDGIVWYSHFFYWTLIHFVYKVSNLFARCILIENQNLANRRLKSKLRKLHQMWNRWIRSFSTHVSLRFVASGRKTVVYGLRSRFETAWLTRDPLKDQMSMSIKVHSLNSEQLVHWNEWKTCSVLSGWTPQQTLYFSTYSNPSPVVPWRDLSILPSITTSSRYPRISVMWGACKGKGDLSNT